MGLPLLRAALKRATLACYADQLACASGHVCRAEACDAVSLSGNGIAVAQGCVEMQHSWGHVVPKP